MNSFRILFVTASLLLSKAALASMVWAAVAIDPATAIKLKTDKQLVEKLLDEPQKGRSAYLDKAWHGIISCSLAAKVPLQCPSRR